MSLNLWYSNREFQIEESSGRSKNMKKIIGLAVLSMVIVLTACGGVSEGKDTSLQNVLDKGTIVLGVFENNSPMSFYNREHELVGFDIEMMREIANKLGVELEIKVTSSGDMKDMDVLSIHESVDITSKQIASTQYHVENKYVILTRKDFIDTEFDSEHLILAESNNKERSVLELGLSKYNTLMVDELFANYIVVRRPGEFKILNVPRDLESKVVGLYVKSGDVLLKDEIDKIITTLKEEGSMKKLSNTWFGNDINLSNRMQ